MARFYTLTDLFNHYYYHQISFHTHLFVCLAILFNCILHHKFTQLEIAKTILSWNKLQQPSNIHMHQTFKSCTHHNFSFFLWVYILKINSSITEMNVNKWMCLQQIRQKRVALIAKQFSVVSRISNVWRMCLSLQLRCVRM